MKRIVIVEDNPDNAELVLDLLEDQYQVDIFYNGADLLNHLEAEPDFKPDAFLLDISLPNMDGITLQKELRKLERFSKAPMLALTAHAMKDDRRHLLDAGFNEYMSKPIVDEALLVGKIEMLTDGAASS
ncbi:MAG: response regulator [Opitutales bacterium]